MHQSGEQRAEAGVLLDLEDDLLARRHTNRLVWLVADGSTNRCSFFGQRDLGS